MIFFIIFFIFKFYLAELKEMIYYICKVKERELYMNRKERIFEFIKSNDYIPLTIDELKVMLGVPDEDFEEFSDILNELVLDGLLFLTKKGRYESCKKAGFISGRLSCNSYGKYAFLIPDDEDEEQIYIGSDCFLDAYNSDRVLVSIDVKNPKTGKREGHVVRILQRGNERVSGIVTKIKNSRLIISPDSKKLYAEITAPAIDEINIGDRVLAELTNYPYAGRIDAIVLKNLGDSNELKSNIEAIIEENSIKQEFDKETLISAAAAPKRVSQKEISSRLDLRDEIIFTIDGDDARDFDDAVSLTMTDDGCFLLGVHIADVTAYVTPGSPLDNEAFLRGTSVYIADRVIPMLPVELSNGICSLNPNVNRLTLSVFIKIDKDGNTQLEKLSKSVIRSCERMTYNDVADILENHDERLSKKYSYILPTLENMQQLASILNKKRMDRGSINFDFPEAHVIVNDMGEPVDIIKAKRRISHKMIEEFMLIANETVAELAFWSELPFVYRVHEPPSVEKTEDFNRFIFNFGYHLKGKFDNDNPIHPKAFAQLLDKISGTDEEFMISTYMLRSLMKAQYKAENLGHFGLSAKYYCHFTSPIRRYPDLFIHRVLKAYLDSEDFNKFTSLCAEVSEHSSKTERNAELCERDTDDLMKTAFMSDKIGECFEGCISSVTGFGFFVELDNTVEGLVRLETMKDDYYEFDDITRTLKGKKTLRQYKIGDRLEVILTRCDLLTRQIDFIRKEDEGLQITSRKNHEKTSYTKNRQRKRNRKKWKNSK